MNHNKLLRSPLTAGAIALTLVLSACGSSAEESESTETTAAETEEETETTEAETETETEEETETTEAEAEEETETTEAETEEAAVDGQAVALGEWFIEIEGEVVAGTTTFALSNNGENPHALAVAVGDTYENLPQLENGAVDTDALGADYIGTSENVVSGGVGEIAFDLPAGDYVFFCPIAFGPNSHARAGQVLSVTVS